MDAMVAVGAIAMSRELRSPKRLMRSRSSGHSGLLGVTPQKSNWSSPPAARVSLNVSCAPRSSASAQEVSSAPK